MTDEKPTDPDLVILQRHVAQLMEHFDVVQILASRHREGETNSILHGEGNLHARIGQCREFLIRQDERAKESVRCRDRDE